ncbi:MAG: hypothetical protein N2444_06400 [Methylocystis sp.]|nr:hypothetical protein [Methylocystis sp.]
MSAIEATRIGAALAIGGLCALIIARAVPIVRFGYIGATQTGVSAALAYGSLVNDRLVGGLAREARFEAAPPSDQRQATAEISAILARRPLSSRHWLELARARYADGSAPEKFFDAVRLSQMTGPNEASIMAGRAVFGLSLWSLAPADLRKALARDLVGGWPQISETRRALLRVMLDVATAQAREEIASSLVAFGDDGGAIAARLGLAGVK